MKRENINYFVVGLFVLTLLTAFLFVIYKITGRAGPTDHYRVTYQNVAGIKFGTPVLYEGFQVGQVELIKPVRENGLTHYQVTFSVIKDWKIPRDSIASIDKSGLLSAISINIEEGSSQSALNPGDLIQGRGASDIFATVNEVAADLRDLSNDGIRPLIDNLNNHIDNIAGELSGLITEDVRPMVKNINQKLDKNVLVELEKLLNQLNEGADRLLVLLNDDNQENIALFLSNINSASGSLNDLLLSIDETRAEMDNVLNSIDTLVDDNKENIYKSISDMQKSLNIVAKHVDTILYHMEGSSRNIHELSRQLRENPGLILNSSPQTEVEEE